LPPFRLTEDLSAFFFANFLLSIIFHQS